MTEIISNQESRGDNPHANNTIDNFSTIKQLNTTISCHEESKIANFYRNRSVFITGASGFVGKVLIEKLLRTCPDIKRVFVLIRPKWNKEPRERLAELLKVPLFDKIRELDRANADKSRLKLEDRVVVVEGDISSANLGISDENTQRIINEVSVIFHSAATVKFDEPLKQSIGINIAGTKNIVELCKKMSNLAALVHVSTAYANCELEEIDEHIYPAEMDPENLIEMANWLDQETLQELKLKLLGPKPNTYTYTKALSEWLLVRIARDLPLAICRPSIVVASWKEPFTGWIDNFNGPTGVILGAGKGLIRSMYAEKSYLADLIPVDTVINMIVTLGWFANVYHSHKRFYDASDYLNESLIDSSSSGIASSASEEDGPSSIEAFETQRRTSRSQQEERGDMYDTNDSNNNDSNEDNQNHEYPEFDFGLRTNVESSVNRDQIHHRDGSKLQRDLQNHLNITLHSDDGYGSASRSPDANSSSASSASECNAINGKSSSTGPRVYRVGNISGREHNLTAETYRRVHQMSSEAHTRLIVQRESAQLEKKLKKFRRNTQLRLKAKNLPEHLADIPVFHCTSGATNPITWGQVQILVMLSLVKFPSISTYRYPCGAFTNNARLDNFYRLTLHYIPGHIIDFITRLLGGKPVLVKIFKKFDQAAQVLKAFTSREWKFEANNGRTLLNEIMSEADRKLFDFDLKDLCWTQLFYNYTLGVRSYLLNEPASSIGQARINLRITYYRNLTLQALFFALIGLYFFKAQIFPFIFGH